MMIASVSKTHFTSLHVMKLDEFVLKWESGNRSTLLIGTPFVPYLAYPAQACRQGALPELTNAHSLTRIILIVFIAREPV